MKKYLNGQRIISAKLRKRNERIIRLWSRGLTQASIARQVGVTQQRVQQIIARGGVDNRGKERVT